MSEQTTTLELVHAAGGGLVTPQGRQTFEPLRDERTTYHGWRPFKMDPFPM